jgi:hypothetical protein
VSGAYYFSTAPDGVVHLMARFESEGDEPMIADVHHEVKPGETFLGIKYRDLKKARGGRVERLGPGKAKIVDEGGGK